MKNIIKMDLYRLIHQKSAWVIMIIAMLMAVISIVLVGIFYNVGKEALELAVNDGEISSIQEHVDEWKETQEDKKSDAWRGTLDDEEDEASIGPSMLWYDEGYTVSVWELMFKNINTPYFILFAGIAMTIFAKGETKNGFIKTIAGKVKSRGYLVLSKLLPCAIYILAIFTVIFAVSIVASQIIFGYISFTGFGDYAIIMLTQYFLYLAFTAMIVAVAVMVNSTSFAMIFTVFLSVGYLQGILDMLSKSFKNWGIVGDDFVISKYLLTGNITNIFYGASNGAVVRALVLSIVYGVIFTIAGVTIYKKRDVK